METKAITVEERALVMRIVMATVELQIPVELQLAMARRFFDEGGADELCLILSCHGRHMARELAGEPQLQEAAQRAVEG